MPYKLNPFTGELDRVNSPGTGTPSIEFDTDSGVANPTMAGVITIAGGTGINTEGAGSTVTVNLDSPVIVDNGGTGLTTLTDGAILVGDGTNPIELIGPLTDGQLLIGDTAGVSPVASTLTAGSNVSIVNGAGSITISAADIPGDVAQGYVTDVNSPAIPVDNALEVIGGTTSSYTIEGIRTDGGSGSDVLTVELTNRILANSFTTDDTLEQLFSFDLGVIPATYIFEMHYAVYNSTLDLGAAYKVIYSLRTDGAAATDISFTTPLNSEDTGMESIILNVSSSGNNFLTEVVGLVGSNISWTVIGTYVKAF